MIPRADPKCSLSCLEAGNNAIIRLTLRGISLINVAGNTSQNNLLSIDVNFPQKIIYK